MQIIRQMTQKGDPIVRVHLPEIIVRMLESNAKKNKRRTQDQFIKSLADSFKKESSLDPLFEKFLPDLKILYQVQ